MDERMVVQNKNYKYWDHNGLMDRRSQGDLEIHSLNLGTAKSRFLLFFLFVFLISCLQRLEIINTQLHSIKDMAHIHSARWDEMPPIQSDLKVV